MTNSPSNILIVGDSYAKPRVAGASGTNTDDGDQSKSYPALLAIVSQGVSGTTAQQWQADEGGMLSKARATTADVLIMSLLGNDAFLAASSGNPMIAAMDIIADLAALTSVVKTLGRKRNLVILYPDPFNGSNEEYVVGLPVLNGLIRDVWGRSGLAHEIVDLREITAPGDFNGVDIHMTASGHAKVAAYLGGAI